MSNPDQPRRLDGKFAPGHQQPDATVGPDAVDLVGDTDAPRQADPFRPAPGMPGGWRDLADEGMYGAYVPGRHRADVPQAPLDPMRDGGPAAMAVDRDLDRYRSLSLDLREGRNVFFTGGMLPRPTPIVDALPADEARERTRLEIATLEAASAARRAARPLGLPPVTAKQKRRRDTTQSDLTMAVSGLRRHVETHGRTADSPASLHELIERYR